MVRHFYDAVVLKCNGSQHTQLLVVAAVKILFRVYKIHVYAVNRKLDMDFFEAFMRALRTSTEVEA